MAREIERTFLVRDDTWRAGVVRVERLVDGLVAVSSGRKVRIRRYQDRATITVKTRRVGSEREEFEFPIPIAEADELLARHCDGTVIAKLRYDVPFGGFTWEVDVYEGPMTGVVLAEVELPEPDTAFPLPPWLGREVTFDPAYKKRALVGRYVQGVTIPS